MPTKTITTGPTAQIAADEMFDAVFERCLHFTIEMDYDNACHFIRRIGQYNDFDWGNVLDALEEIDRLIPRRSYGPGNPNNGQRDYTLRIGREGSPVLYLERLEFGDKDELTIEQMTMICSEMETIGMADESDFSTERLAFCPGRKITFRFWWD